MKTGSVAGLNDVVVTYNCAEKHHGDCTGDHDGISMQLSMSQTGKLHSQK